MMIRWSSEIPKLVSTATEACLSMGGNKMEVRTQMAVIYNEIAPGRTKSLFMLKKTPFTSLEANTLNDSVTSLGASYNASFIPFITEDEEPYKSFFDNSITDDQFYNNFDFKVKPVTDDSPYHFNFGFGIPDSLSEILSLSLILTCGFIAAPIAVAMIKTRSSSDNKLNKVTYLLILLVSLLGIGYITIEIAMTQRFILFLGYPTRALSVILFSLLLSSGIGSLTAGRLIRDKNLLTKGMLIALLFIIVITCAYAVYLPSVFNALISQEATTRIVLSVLMIFPLGFFMGIPFPSTLRLMSNSSATNTQIAWLWGINGATSVLGSILTTIIGMLSGYSFAILLSACVYGVALLTVLFLKMKCTIN